MQISSLKMEAGVSLTQSLSIISLFPSLALKHLLQHRLRPTGSLSLCLSAASNVINAAELGRSTSVPRQFKEHMTPATRGRAVREVGGPGIFVSLISV